MKGFFLFFVTNFAILLVLGASFRLLGIARRFPDAIQADGQDEYLCPGD